MSIMYADGGSVFWDSTTNLSSGSTHEPNCQPCDLHWYDLTFILCINVLLTLITIGCFNTKYRNSEYSETSPFVLLSFDEQMTQESCRDLAVAAGFSYFVLKGGSNSGQPICGVR